MDNREYLLRRTGWLNQVSRSFEEKRNQCLVIDKLNQISNPPDGSPLKVQGLFSTSYPASFRVRYKDVEREVVVWVKETRVGYNAEVPYTLINECKMMKTVIRDMFYKRRSPHFIYPIVQVLTNDRSVLEDDMIDVMNERIEESAQLCASSESSQDEGDLKEHLAVYNIMEYLPQEKFFSFRMFLKDLDFNEFPDQSSFELVPAVFQILYNLSVMENLKFRHGDLHLDNILTNPLDRFMAYYVIDESTAYAVPSPVFTMFIDFDRSIINTESYRSITIPERHLETKPCSTGKDPLTGRMKQNLPNGVVEDCWKTWNPYADLTRFFALVFRKAAEFDKPEILMSLFPKEDQLRMDLETLIGGRPFGRQSFKELQEEFPGDFLERCLPTNVLKRFAGQFFTVVDPKLIDTKRNQVYFAK